MLKKQTQRSTSIQYASNRLGTYSVPQNSKGHVTHQTSGVVDQKSSTPPFDEPSQQTPPTHLTRLHCRLTHYARHTKKRNEQTWKGGEPEAFRKERICRGQALADRGYPSHHSTLPPSSKWEESIVIPNPEALLFIPAPLGAEAHLSENPRHSHSDTHPPTESTTC